MNHRRSNSDDPLQITSPVDVNNIECNDNKENIMTQTYIIFAIAIFQRMMMMLKDDADADDENKIQNHQDYSKGSSLISKKKIDCKQCQENDQDSGSTI